jgi:hypothetical protein
MQYSNHGRRERYGICGVPVIVRGLAIVKLILCSWSGKNHTRVFNLLCVELTISSIIIAHLLGKYANSSDAAVAFIYFKYDLKEDKLTSVAVVGNILKQLAVQNVEIRRSLKDLHLKHKEMGTNPTYKELLDTLARNASRLKILFVVVDALDEAPETGLSPLSELHKISNLKLIITARPNVGFRIVGFGASIKTLEIRARDVDILKYVKSETSRAPYLIPLVNDDPFLLDTIATKIVEKAKGMYFNPYFNLANH